MIILGVILLIIGFVAGISILWTIGIILLVVGLILALLGTMGRAVGPRRHYWQPYWQPNRQPFGAMPRCDRQATAASRARAAAPPTGAKPKVPRS